MGFWAFESKITPKIKRLKNELCFVFIFQAGNPLNMGSKGSNAAVSAWFEGEMGENWGLSKGGNVANLAPDVKKPPCRAV